MLLQLVLRLSMFNQVHADEIGCFVPGEVTNRECNKYGNSVGLFLVLKGHQKIYVKIHHLPCIKVQCYLNSMQQF